ncbi:hypothetical protein GCM10010467_29270 [Actinocorallia glomerata]|uniref:Uncharacterized protein n=2 Tax=Actinomycetes TaxID=1760 RepID=A0ABP6LWA3_9MICC
MCHTGDLTRDCSDGDGVPSRPDGAALRLEPPMLLPESPMHSGAGNGRTPAGAARSGADGPGHCGMRHRGVEPLGVRHLEAPHLDASHDKARHDEVRYDGARYDVPLGRERTHDQVRPHGA